jgi:hypothetical protein
MKKEVKIEPILEEYKSIFHEKFDEILDKLITERPFDKIIVKIDVDPSFKEPYLIMTSDGVSEVIINFFTKPNKDIFLRHVAGVINLIE